MVDAGYWVVGAGPHVGHRGDARRVRSYPCLDRDPVDALHVEQLVEDSEPRLLRVVVDAVQTGEEAVALGPQALEYAVGLRRVGEQHGPAAVKFGAKDRAGDRLG